MRLELNGGVLACGLLALALGGCVHGSSSSVEVARRAPVVEQGRHHHGPPPHAPAHGYRRKHQRYHDRHPHHHDHAGRVRLVFDSELGVYLVVDLPNHYFWNGSYLRIQDGDWYASPELYGRWAPCSSRSLPPGLRKKHAKGRKPKKERRGGPVPANRPW